MKKIKLLCTKLKMKNYEKLLSFMQEEKNNTLSLK